MTTIQQSRAEYELSKYVYESTIVPSMIFAYTTRRYLQLCDGDESQSLTENAAICGSLRDCIELGVLRLGTSAISC